MPLDDYASTSAPVSQSAARALPQQGKKKASKNSVKDEIIVNPNETQIVQEAAEKHHVMAFGRMNPITSGHEAVVQKIHDVAKEHNAGHTLVVSHSQDTKKNPLSAEQKVKHASHAFPDTNVKAASKDAPTILHHAAQLHKQGVKHLHVVAGSDRQDEMNTLLHKYNTGEKHGHGAYHFKSITVHSSGERDPDAEGTKGMSASKMREHASSGNKKEFHKGAPSKMSKEHKDEMYQDVRKGMGLHESVDLEERVVSQQQRRARGVLMRRMQSRLTRARNIMKTKTANPAQLTRRAYKQAKQNLRRRFAGSRGIEYQHLGPSGKVAVDTQIDPKVKNIKALVQRIMPRIKQSDFRRLQATRSGKAYHSNPMQFNSVELDINKFNKLYEAAFKDKVGNSDPGEHQANVLKLKAQVKKIEGKKPKTVWNPETRRYKVVYEEVQAPKLLDLNESFGTFYTAKDLGIVAEGGFAMHPSVQSQLDEDAADHLRQASIMQRTGKLQKAAQHRKIAAALQRGDATGAKALRTELGTLKD